MNLEQEVIMVLKSSLRDTIVKHLGDYSSPLRTMVNDAVKVHDSEIRKLIYESVSLVFTDNEFRDSAKAAIKKKIARDLVNVFGEGIFKQSIEKLKADPTIKARAILAIERILEGEE